MSAAEPEEHNRASGMTRRRLIIYVVVLVTVFLIGLVPMWLVARQRAAQRDQTERYLRLCRLENDLASAVVDARRGEYERARRAASSFFTSLLQQVEQLGGPSDLTAAQRENLRPLLFQRDQVITLLARSDPAAADRLSEVYMAFNKGML